MDMDRDIDIDVDLVYINTYNTIQEIKRSNSKGLSGFYKRGRLTV